MRITPKKAVKSIIVIMAALIFMASCKSHRIVCPTYAQSKKNDNKAVVMKEADYYSMELLETKRISDKR